MGDQSDTQQRTDGPVDPPDDPNEFGSWFDREFGDEGVPEQVVVPEHDGDRSAGVRTRRVRRSPAELFGDAGRRIVRRPVEWWERPWTTERVVQVVITGLTLLVTAAVMASVVHLNPLNSQQDLIFDDTTPTGGDMGAHVWGPAFLRDHLLPHLQLSGWSMDWYGGMPVYRFYMVVPALMIVALDVLLPYGVAMKLVVISGLMTMPAACWAFGRLARFRFPIPELFAFAGLAFVLDESFSIYGGNLKSTMAGEFSFSIALSLAMLGLGLLANGLRTGRHRVWTAIVLALACCSHGIVLIFVMFVAAIMVLVWADRTRLVFGLTVGLTTFLLSAFWVVPFLLNHQYMTDMKYGARPEGATDSFWDMFFPLTPPLDILITTLAVIGFLGCVFRRHLTGAALGVSALWFVLLVYLTRDSLPVINLLWNPRLLPFIYLLRYMLMMIGIVEIIGLVVQYVRGGIASDDPGFATATVTAVATGLTVLIVIGFMFEALPGGNHTTSHGASVYAWGLFQKTPPPPDKGTDALGDGWSAYNFRGYEGRPSYPEYHQVVTTMARIGEERGCGRALWENNGDNGQYGTTMALMLLPHWTDGCIGSMEGLFFEASGTTPYHFLTTAAMSKNSSNPVRELRYVDNDAEVGIPEMQVLGVRYLMVRTDEAKREADARPELTLLATPNPWNIYQVADSDIVVPLTVQPVVARGRDGDQRERHLELGTSWFQNRGEWAAMPADDGPDSWQRISVRVDLDRREGEPGGRPRKVDIVVPVEPIESVPLPAIEVSDVDIDQQSLSFHVDQVGVPVLVKVSYFPNWKVTGADGPYRIAPNLMVVIPTSNDVEMNFTRSRLDLAAYVLTLAGIALCVLWRRRGDVRHAAPTPSFGRPVAAPVGVGWGGAPVEPRVGQSDLDLVFDGDGDGGDIDDDRPGDDAPGAALDEGNGGGPVGGDDRSPWHPPDGRAGPRPDQPPLA